MRIIISLFLVLFCFCLAASESSESSFEKYESPKRKRKNQAGGRIIKKSKVVPEPSSFFSNQYGEAISIKTLKVIDMVLCNGENIVIRMDAKDINRQLINAGKKIRDTTSGLIKSFIPSESVAHGIEYVPASARIAQFFLKESNHFTSLFGSRKNKNFAKVEEEVLLSSLMRLLAVAKEVNGEYVLRNTHTEIILIANDHEYPVVLSGEHYLSVSRN
jgi:hypothetical protein